KLAPDGTETTLYSFCQKPNCADGSTPKAALISDSAGNLYGTTWSGGAHQGGTVFMLTPAGKEKVLYSFCRKAKCADGAQPYAGLLADGAGNLYGTTVTGGKNNAGTVFKIGPDGAETVLHSFCLSLGCGDGRNPYGGLIADSAGNLYGTTEGNE